MVYGAMGCAGRVMSKKLAWVWQMVWFYTHMLYTDAYRVTLAGMMRAFWSSGMPLFFDHKPTSRNKTQFS